ncbi:MAG: hypothetical protein M3O15_02000 [Acidobacteriota bacterium]|nr:hypothetical protein [Acidobacteriota bacterium]
MTEVGLAKARSGEIDFDSASSHQHGKLLDDPLRQASLSANPTAEMPIRDV